VADASTITPRSSLPKILKVRLLVFEWGQNWLAVAGAFFANDLDVPTAFAACFLVCATNRRVWVMDCAKSPVFCFILALCAFLRLGGTFCRLLGLGGLWGVLRGHSCAEKEKEEAKKKRLGSGVGAHCKKYLGGLKMWRVCAEKKKGVFRREWLLIFRASRQIQGMFRRSQSG